MLEAVKSYLRIDSDLTDDDAILTQLIEAAKRYIARSTGKKYVADDPLMTTLVCLLVSHWHTNRNAMNGKSNSAEYPHSITALLQHIEISPAYEDDKA
jgi:DNA packaging protein, QLRG family|nr:MAG TPA: head tail connector [Caudoviricetes sp.]